MFVRREEHLISFQENNTYDQLILTNFIENSEDFVKKFSLFEDVLNHNNKIIISSINSKWNFIVSILSSLKIIKSEIPKTTYQRKRLKTLLKDLATL